MLAAPASACTVTAVQDGDTLTVTCPDGRVKVRLVEIDAPERTQPYSRISTNSLRTLCLGQPARLDRHGIDRYGRTLARVHCAGVDANAEQIRRGLAWAFTRHLTDPEIARIELEARAQRRGLWRADQPIAPWDFRSQHR